MTNEGLLVVGAHRSGTSAAARVLSLLGAALPPNLMEAVPGDNETGYWESRAVSELDDRLLGDAGLAWDSVAPMPEGHDPVRHNADELDEAIEWLREHFDEASSFVLKDPRMSRLLPFWIEAVERIGARPRILLCLRHPLDVAASLRARDGFAEETGVAVWLRAVLEAERASRGQSRATAWYGELLTDPEAWLRGIHRSWGREVPEHPEGELRRFLREDLRHHRSEGLEYGLRGGLFEMAAEVHRALLEPTELEANAEALDRAHESLRIADRLLGSTMRRSEVAFRESLHVLDRVERALNGGPPEDAEPGPAPALGESRARRARELVAGVREMADHARRLETWARELEAAGDELQGKTAEYVSKLEASLESSETQREDLARWAEELRGERERLEPYARNLRQELDAVLPWAEDLQQQLDAALPWGADLQRQLDEVVPWARSLQRQLDEVVPWARDLQRQLDEVVPWAADLQRQLDEVVPFARKLEAELQTAGPHAHKLQAHYDALNATQAASEAEIRRLQQENEALRMRADHLERAISFLRKIPGARTLWRLIDRKPPDPIR